MQGPSDVDDASVDDAKYDASDGGKRAFNVWSKFAMVHRRDFLSSSSAVAS